MKLSLEKAKEMAQKSANQTRSPMTLWNLNIYDSLYVVRDGRLFDSEKKGFVAQFNPQ